MKSRIIFGIALLVLTLFISSFEFKSFWNKDECRHNSDIVPRIDFAKKDVYDYKIKGILMNNSADKTYKTTLMRIEYCTVSGESLGTDEFRVNENIKPGGREDFSYETKVPEETDHAKLLVVCAIEK